MPESTRRSRWRIGELKRLALVPRGVAPALPAPVILGVVVAATVPKKRVRRVCALLEWVLPVPVLPESLQSMKSPLLQSTKAPQLIEPRPPMQRTGVVKQPARLLTLIYTPVLRLKLRG